MIVFEKCNREKRVCKDEAVIDEWLKFKYLVALENEKRFVQDGFRNERIAEYSSIVWYAISP